MKTLHKLTKLFLDDATDTFSMIAGGNSVFDVDRLPTALQSLGLSMQGNHFKDTVDNITVDLGLFLQIVSACMDDPDWMVTETQEAFLVFDRGDTGIAVINDFKRVLTKLGENVGDKEIEDQIMTLKTSHVRTPIESLNTNFEKQLTVDDFVVACRNAEEMDNDSPDEKND